MSVPLMIQKHSGMMPLQFWLLLLLFVTGPPRIGTSPQPEQQHHHHGTIVSAFTATTTITIIIPSTTQPGIRFKTRTPWDRPLLSVPILSLLSSTTPLDGSATSSTGSSTACQPKKGILYDIPVSNHGARCRLILYKKGIGSEEIQIQPPSVLGGLTSETYRSYNPEGKMPLLVCTGTNTLLPNSNDETCGVNHDVSHIFESDTIARFLLHEYDHLPPSFQINLVRSNLIVRIHDMYISTIQGCMYKAKPPFGTYNTRSDALQEIIRQLTIIENLMVPPVVSDDSNTNNENSRPYYLCGNEVSLADATIFPTMVFATYMLPKFDITVPPKLQDWYNQLLQYDPDFRKVQQEIMDPLQVWDTINHRWDTILGAGWRDTAPSTIFDQIMNGTIPATKIDVSDDTILAFRDINPVAPAHVLLIPKYRYGLTQLSMATSEHTEILGRLLVTAASMARNESIGFGPNGCRIVINDGNYGGQEVMHLHVHLLGGRPMSWPPG